MWQLSDSHCDTAVQKNQHVHCLSLYCTDLISNLFTHTTFVIYHYLHGLIHCAWFPPLLLHLYWLILIITFSNHRYSHLFTDWLLVMLCHRFVLASSLFCSSFPCFHRVIPFFCCSISFFIAFSSSFDATLPFFIDLLLAWIVIVVCFQYVWVCVQ